LKNYRVAIRVGFYAVYRLKQSSCHAFPTLFAPTLSCLSGKLFPVTILAHIKVSAKLAIPSRLENPVDATQFFSLTNQPSPVTGEASGAAPSVKSEGNGAVFADLFKAQIQSQVRQEFAAPVQELVELQVVPLGPTINLITANTPLPDMSALASFARAQGLDEEAVKTLFGLATEVTEKKLADSLQLPELVAQTLQIEPNFLNTAQVLSMQGVGAKLTVAALAPEELKPGQEVDAKLIATALAPEELKPGQDVGAKLIATALTPEELKSGADISASIGVSILVQAPGATVKASALPKAEAVTSGAFMTTMENKEDLSTEPRIVALGALKDAPVPKISSAEISLVSVEIGNAPQAIKARESAAILQVTANPNTDDAEGVLRIRLEAPTEAITQKLSDVSGTKEPQNWRALLASAALAAGGKAAVSSATELLNIDVSPVLLAELTEPVSTEVPNFGSASFSSAFGESTRIHSPSGGSGEMSQNTSAEQRGEQYQQLADRMGQAVAQRLLAQIERGEWKLQLRLQPESLGRVDVSLEMHSGGLDALFNAENGVTRDLIAQGAAKLRDALTQSGMAVASVFVNSDQGRKSDGNPTSGRSFKGGSGGGREKDDESIVAVSDAKRVSSSASGLDVLA
jgi:flagellar hook-length control protein FliK